MSNICIKSDFLDYYDILNDEKSNIIYNRYLCESVQRGTALKYLRSLGIKTLELKQVNRFFRDEGPIVVYTNPKAHNGAGKKILTVDEALQSYENCIASKYYQTEGNYTLKYLQVGKRRFTLYFKRDNNFSLELGQLVDIKESTPEYNRIISKPIFSIDYISNGREMIATDFNEFQNLSLIGFDAYMKPADIINEISDSLTVYNKLEVIR